VTHNLAFTIDQDGNIVLVYHPNDDQTRAVISELATVVEDRRAGHVWPTSPVLRLAFRAIRAVFGSRGRMADWTRRWRCRWVVVDAETMTLLPGVYASHDEAVNAEVEWSLHRDD